MSIVCMCWLQSHLGNVYSCAFPQCPCDTLVEGLIDGLHLCQLRSFELSSELSHMLLHRLQAAGVSLQHPQALLLPHSMPPLGGAGPVQLPHAVYRERHASVRPTLLLRRVPWVVQV